MGEVISFQKVFSDKNVASSERILRQKFAEATKLILNAIVSRRKGILARKIGMAKINKAAKAHKANLLKHPHSSMQGDLPIVTEMIMITNKSN